MFGVDWATAAGAFGAGLVIGIVVTVRLTKVLADERRDRNHNHDEGAPDVR